MRVEELLQACCTPCDELLIKFKDEPLDENNPRKDTVRLKDSMVNRKVLSFWIEDIFEPKKEKYTKFFVIVIE